MGQVIDHNELDDALERCGSGWNASQAQGLLCSRLSVTGAAGARRWIAQIMSDVADDAPERNACEQLLDNLCSETWRQLGERQSEFQLLLPQSDDLAAVRADAMGQWCEGFLHGLVTEKHSEGLKKRLAEEPLADIIKDMLQITRATVDDDDDNIDDDFSELVEYLRVVVQLVYEELADFRDLMNPADPDSSTRLH